ncbi:MAG: TIGR01458 family HAD-type hydrolase [Candidatus Zixiibacteriota bacterium]|nr:MAG: TIGR01458 family HAD-type hydrolase [candidate division Zixibacteria bacterium]
MTEKPDWVASIKGLLIDLDGTLYVGDRLIDGASEAVKHLKDAGHPLRFTTNTTTRSLASLYNKLTKLGLPVEESEVFGVIRAAVAYLHSKEEPRCHLLVSDGPKVDFAEFPQDDRNPEIVVIGDVGKTWDYQLMHRLFEMVMNGAEIVALHKGKYWETEQGLRVDMGAFIAGLEYVTDKTATVIGKPSETFFRLALDDLGLPADQVAVVGDDLASDIGGAQRVGMHGILVRTGKYRESYVTGSPIQPDLMLDSAADLVKIF